MEHRAIITVNFGIYEILNGKCNHFKYNGKAMNTVDGDNLEDCINKVKVLLKKNGFVITKEQGNEIASQTKRS